MLKTVIRKNEEEMAGIEESEHGSATGAETSDTSSDHEVVLKNFQDKGKSFRRPERNARQRERDRDAKFDAILEEMREDRKIMMAMMARILKIEEWHMGLDVQTARESKANISARKGEEDQTIPMELERPTEAQCQQENLTATIETRDEEKEIKREQAVDTPIRMINIPHIGSSIHIQTFRGDPGENPAVHLDSIREFLCFHPMSEKEKITVASHYLRESAKAWWKLLKQPPSTMRGYEEAILKRYWSVEKQEGLLHQFSNMKYDESSGQSFAAFFTHQAMIFKSLTAFNYTEQHITRIVIHNLPPWVQRIMLGSCPMSFENTVELLNQIDYGDLYPTKGEWEHYSFKTRPLKPYIPPDPGRR